MLVYFCFPFFPKKGWKRGGQEGGRGRRRKNEAKKLKREMKVIFFPKAMAVVHLNHKSD